MSKMSQREKVLLVVLIALILGSGYYMLFYKPIQAQKAEYEAELLSIDDQILTLEARATQMKNMENELDRIFAEGVENIKMLPTFDNSRILMETLNFTLSSARSYNIQFNDADVSGTIARRSVNLTYSCVSYGEAKMILSSIYNGPFPCVIHNVSMSLGEGTYNVTVELVYFENVQ